MLVDAHKARQRHGQLAGFVAVVQLALIGGRIPILPADQQLGTGEASDFGDAGGDGGRVTARHQRHALAGNASLFAGDVENGRAEPLRVVQPQLCDAGN